MFSYTHQYFFQHRLNFGRSFRNKFRFTEEEVRVWKQMLPFVPAGYIRAFDVISRVNCVSLRRKCRLKTALPSRQARNIQNFEAFVDHDKHPLGVSTLFCEF